MKLQRKMPVTKQEPSMPPKSIWPVRRRGAAVVEFAVVAPLFILLVFGMIEYGRMLMVQQVITNAAREGARVAVLEGSSPLDVQNTINAYLGGAGIDSPDIDLEINGASLSIDSDQPITSATGAPVTVTVSVGFDQVSWLPSPMYLGGKNLSSTTVMRRESAG